MKFLTMIAVISTLILTGCGDSIPVEDEAPVLGFGTVVLQCGNSQEVCPSKCEIYFDDPDMIGVPIVLGFNEVDNTTELFPIPEGMHSATARVFEHCGNSIKPTRDNPASEYRFSVDAGGIKELIYNYIDPNLVQ